MGETTADASSRETRRQVRVCRETRPTHCLPNALPPQDRAASPLSTNHYPLWLMTLRSPINGFA
ncbi:MAG: hypothetical protein KME31_23350 [Tolypothrix carrinoi HA7290-LM1]|nr:hypothetical protein [Tolypothrix carrinoi HA7290-LM1]